MRKDLLPSAGIALGASMWGLFWIPVRGIETAGVESFWAGPVVFAAGGVLFLPVLILRIRTLIAGWRAFLLPGLLSGLAFSLYTASLLITELVRAMLLFYISPLWSILLGVFILNEKLTLNRMLAVLLSLGGLYVMLMVEGGFPIPRNAGDWLALASGICWSVASVRLFQGGVEQLLEKVTTFIFCAFVTSLMLVYWQQGGFDGMPGLATLQAGWYWIAIIAVAMMPICYLTIWPATVLSPARVGMLLMMEVLVGVISAAILTDEPFGTRELSGTILVISAALVEVARQQKQTGSDKVAESQ